MKSLRTRGGGPLVASARGANAATAAARLASASFATLAPRRARSSRPDATSTNTNGAAIQPGSGAAESESESESASFVLLPTNSPRRDTLGSSPTFPP
jgi:hypothetical protein